MKRDGTIVNLARIEITTRIFNAKNQCVREESEFYYPPEPAAKEIGFRPKKK